MSGVLLSTTFIFENHGDRENTSLGRCRIRSDREVPFPTAEIGSRSYAVRSHFRPTLERFRSDSVVLMNTRRIVFAGAKSVFHRFAPVPRIFIYVFPSAYSVYNQRTVSVFLFVRVFRARPRRPRPLSLASFPDRLADTSPLCRSASHLPCDPFDLGIPNPCPRRSIRFVERLSIFVVRVKTSTRRVPVT